MNFSVEKDQLEQIVSTSEKRSYAQELDLLRQHGGNLDWLISGVGSDKTKGISNDEDALKMRQEVFGTNVKAVKEPPTFIELLCQALQDFTLRILLVAAILSIALETAAADPDQRSTKWTQGFGILLAVFICSFVTAINDYQKERQFQSLNSVADEKKKVTLKRDGITLQLHQDFLLTGDIVHVHEGMEVPADGILTQSNDITTDQSAMTGQTEPIKKCLLKECLTKQDQIEQNGQKNVADRHQVPSPILMSGTTILTGQGKMMVLVVGEASCIGRIREKVNQDDSQPTPLQAKLQKLAGDIGKFGLYSAILIVVILLIRFAIMKGISKQWDTGKDLGKLLDYLILAIIVVVLAIPEGLPLAVTLSLAFSVKKMLADQNLVRRMEACETMGGANNICSDKTGTLTMNQMVLTQIWNVETKMVNLHQEQFLESELSKNQEYNELFKISSLVNSSALLRPQEKGSSTEIALLKYFKKMNVNYEDYRQKYESKIKFPFSSSRKRMSIVTNYKEDAHLFIKGASELVLSSCHEWYNCLSGEVQPITTELDEQIHKVIVKMAQNSLRTLCLGYKKLSAHDDLETKDKKGVYECEKSNIILLAIIGVRDNPREEVPDSIRKCHRAGITVRMVTGDNIITAKAIAKDVGIIQEGKDYLAMEGPQFNKLVGGVVCTKCRTVVCKCPTTKQKAKELDTDIRVDTVANAQAFDSVKDKLIVLARSRPEDKYCLVTGLKERGDVVAVTGDGTNDAPALKKADVGFAMGICGTEVARQAAAIILIDDNFASIVKAVLWGRNIYDSIRKFVQFQLTVNVVAVFCTLIGAAVIEGEILQPIQMLWVNLIMDTLASLALATQDPEESLLERSPHSRDQYIISTTMLKHIIGQSIFQIAVILILTFTGQNFIPEYSDSLDSSTFANDPGAKWHNGVIGGTVRNGRHHFVNGDKDYLEVYEEYSIHSRHFTLIFNVFVMMQIFNFLNARKLHEEYNVFHRISMNPIFIFIVIGIFVLQAILVTFGGRPFGVYSNFGLTIQHWGISIALGSISLLVSLILKLIPIGKSDHVHEERGGFGNRKLTDMKRRSVLSLKRIQQRVDRDLAKNHPFN